MTDPERFVLKTPDEIGAMRLAGKLAAEVLAYGGSLVRPGVSTLQISDACHDMMKARGAVSATLGYKGFPAPICTSVNDVVCHGIPRADEILREGDIVNLDVTVILKGWYGDCSRTFPVGRVSPAAADLMRHAETALGIGIAAVRPQGWMGEIGEAIEAYLKPKGYGIVRALGGHGIGRKFHEGLYVSHHRTGGKGVRLRPGMTFTIEPMVNEGGYDVYVDERDHWTVLTRDGGLSAQFEHTVAIREDRVEILTEAPADR